MTNTNDAFDIMASDASIHLLFIKKCSFKNNKNVNNKKNKIKEINNKDSKSYQDFE